MKYLVSHAAILRFPDNTQFELSPGIHSFPREVIEHWAFSAHAKPVSDDDINVRTQAGDLAQQIETLKAQIAEKDKYITELKAQLSIVPSASVEAVVSGPEKVKSHGKKQQATNS
ncbi:MULTISPECIES: STY1053 family phage-associated protein [Yersinia]|uniref:STY1053 family phage-associated protein n=1 Tax=Yersinia TaxID=629 RepID=UPI0001A54275|nr:MULTISPECIES: hypothetical protein [Yersinia]EEP89178.1 hypothetical protein ykris0001_2370 [Yersinia kristensenii ATCC 33638]PEH52757.1 hypothetical protein CRM81_04975 [Yersinia kristensenii]CNK98425.1 Uncharacterised protein [Yersinia enterocolitica]SUP70611.1 Uncharacterised protein [Yersinia kristensenii]